MRPASGRKKATPAPRSTSRAAPARGGDEALERIWHVVAELPPGRVVSYGEVAALAGLPGRARLVGRALKVAPRALKLPWHRVLTASGKLAFPVGSAAYEEQRRKLAREGVQLVNGRVARGAGTPRGALDALLWGGAH